MVQPAATASKSKKRKDAPKNSNADANESTRKKARKTADTTAATPNDDLQQQEQEEQSAGKKSKQPPQDIRRHNVEWQGYRPGEIEYRTADGPRYVGWLVEYVDQRNASKIFYNGADFLEGGPFAFLHPRYLAPITLAGFRAGNHVFDNVHQAFLYCNAIMQAVAPEKHSTLCEVNGDAVSSKSLPGILMSLTVVRKKEDVNAAHKVTKATYEDVANSFRELSIQDPTWAKQVQVMWADDIKRACLKHLTRLKYDQNPVLRLALMMMGKCPLFFAAKDKGRGVGMMAHQVPLRKSKTRPFDGQNLEGIITQEVREDIRRDDEAKAGKVVWPDKPCLQFFRLGERRHQAKQATKLEPKAEADIASAQLKHRDEWIASSEHTKGWLNYLMLAERKRKADLAN